MESNGYSESTDCEFPTREPENSTNSTSQDIAINGTAGNPYLSATLGSFAGVSIKL